jgi:hypothetical protein
MLFKKNDSSNLVSKSTKYWEKNRPQETKEAKNVVFNWKGKIPFLFYCDKHIHGQFKTYLKPEFLLSKKWQKVSRLLPWLPEVLYHSPYSRSYLFYARRREALVERDTNFSSLKNLYQAHDWLVIISSHMKWCDLLDKTKLFVNLREHDVNKIQK